MKPRRTRILLPSLILALVIFPSNISLGHNMALVVKRMDTIPVNQMVQEVGNSNIVFIGETHSDREHHQAQLEIIRALKGSGAKLAVGLEMFRADRQDALDKWVRGETSKEDFKDIFSDYWNLPWDLYEDIFNYAREQGIPMIGLNVPTEIAQKVSKDGFASLTVEDLKKLPLGISCDVDEEYMKYIRMAHKAHGESGKRFQNFCEAQLMWDKVMAWYIVDYLERNPDTTVVVLAGSIHAWKKGIPEQVKRQSGFSYKVIIPWTPDKAGFLKTDYADYYLN